MYVFIYHLYTYQIFYCFFLGGRGIMDPNFSFFPGLCHNIGKEFCTMEFSTMVTQSSHYTLNCLFKQENSWLEWSDLNIGLSGRLEGGVKGVQNLGWMDQGVTGLTLAPDLTLIFFFSVVCSALFKLQCPLWSYNCPSVILFWRCR